jgi:hypothetical protein
LRIGSTAGGPNTFVSFSVVISTAGRSVDATQNDIVLATDVTFATTASGNPDCTSTTGEVGTAFLPPGCTTGATPGPTPGPCTAVRVNYARTLVPDGTIAYTCHVNINSTAPAGAIELVCQNAIYLNDMQQQRPALCTTGVIVVQ